MQLLKGFVIVGLVMMTGCASLSENECLTADWRAIGYEDAVKGEMSTRMGSHREACAKHGVTPNLQQYRLGYDEGLAVFCTDSSGYNRGLNGHQYKGICPAHLEDNFLDGYLIGQEIYQAASAVGAIESRQQSNYKEQQRIGRLLQENEDALFDTKISEKERRAIYKALSELKESQGRLRQEHDDLIRSLTDAQIRLSTLRSRYNNY